MTGLVKKANDNGPDPVAATEEVIRQQFGFDLRKDLIAGLGPKLAFYMQTPAEGAAIGGNRAARMIGRLSGHHDLGPDPRPGGLDPGDRAADEVVQHGSPGRPRGQHANSAS